MNRQHETFNVYIPVKALRTFNNLYNAIVLRMHETLNQHAGSALYPAVAALPGSELFHLLRKKRNNPLLYPAFI
jgi:hypothetical protein